MNISRPEFRVLSGVLLIVLAVSLATPGPAEAIDPMTAMAVAGAAVGVVILTVFLVVANMHSSEQSAGSSQHMACGESDPAPRGCWGLPSEPALAPSVEPATFVRATDVPVPVASGTPES